MQGKDKVVLLHLIPLGLVPPDGCASLPHELMEANGVDGREDIVDAEAIKEQEEKLREEPTHNEQEADKDNEEEEEGKNDNDERQKNR